MEFIPGWLVDATLSLAIAGDDDPFGESSEYHSRKSFEEHACVCVLLIRVCHSFLVETLPTGQGTVCVN